MPGVLIAYNKLSLNCLKHKFLIFLSDNVLIVNIGFSKVISSMGPYNSKGLLTLFILILYTYHSLEAHITAARLVSKQEKYFFTKGSMI